MIVPSSKGKFYGPDTLKETLVDLTYMLFPAKLYHEYGQISAWNCISKQIGGGISPNAN